MTSTPAESTAPAIGSRPAQRGRLGRLIDAVDERMGIKALEYPVPEHANNLGWSLGGVTAVTFLVLLVTGVYMAQFYNPMPEDANQSIRDMMTDVWLGTFVRSLHWWASQAMFVFAGLHMARVFIHGSFKRPREGNWLVGASMFTLTFLAIFTGTVIKWDQEGFEALAHNVDVAELLGGVGSWFTPDLTSRVPIVLRLYVAHAVIIPGLILMLFVLHALLVKRHGISSHPAIPRPDVEVQEPFTHHLRRVAAFGLVLIAVLSILAILVPPVLGPTPVEGVEVTRPLWMFWWFFPFEEWFGVPSVGLFMGAVFALIFVVPFLDRSPKRHWKDRKAAISVAVIILLAIVAISIQVWITSPRGHG